MNARLLSLLMILALLTQACSGSNDTVDATTHAGEEAHDHNHGDHNHDEHAEAGPEYVCPMHPQIRQPHFGLCPICNMDLVPVASGGEDSDIDVLQFSDASLALLEIDTHRVARQKPSRTLRVQGEVVSDPRAQTIISAWTAGRIERLTVPPVGERVARGASVARLFSPSIAADLDTAALIDSDYAPERQIAEAARQRLRNAGVSSREIEAAAAGESSGGRITLRAAHGGTVARRLVREGDYVEEGQALVELSNTEALWVELSLDAAYWPETRVGQEVQLTLPGAAPIASEVAFVSPLIDAETRKFTARVLLPEGHAPVAIGARVRAQLTQTPEVAPRVVIPESALLWTGERSVVYVVDRSASPPVYQPVEVRAGERWGEWREIREGLFLGEEVVHEGAFRLDATLYLRSGAGMLRSASENGAQGEHAQHGGGHEHH